MNTDFFYMIVVANFFSFVLMLITSGKPKEFFKKVFAFVFLIFIITILITVKSGQLK